MKHTVKRLLSLLLVLILCLSLFPVAALAEPEGEIAPVEDSAEPWEDCVLDVPSDGSGSISMVPPPAEQQDTLPSGTCGDRLSWIFDEDSGVLTISGDGEMWDFHFSQSSGIDSPWYSYRTQIVTVVLPDGITTVGNNAFRNCSALTRINLPEGITSIGASSFAFCRQLSAVSIPGSAEKLGGSAFYECSGLTSVELQPGLAEIGDSAFHKCTALTEISLPASVMRIRSKAFNGCSALTQISFLGHAPTIAGDAFTGVSAVARYPGASGSWNSDTLQNYGGTLSWEPYYEKYELYILGTQLDESHLSGLLDNTLAYSYDPGENVLSLQGSYTVTAEDPDSLIRSGIEGLTIRIDSDTRLYLDERDEDFSFFALAKDATITGDRQLQLYAGSGSGLFTGVSVGDGAELTLLDAKLYCSGLTYGLRGDPDGESALYFVRATATLNGSWGGVRWFSGGISLRNSAIVEPEAYRVSDDGSILRGTGSTPAATVRVEPRYDLVIDGTPVTDLNRADVLSNGVFSFDGDHTLTVSGDYTGTADVLIDSNLYSLVVNVPGTAVLTNSSSASETALIRSSGDLFLSGGGYLSLKHAENAGDDSCGVLLIGANEATLSVQQCMLNVSNVARGFATSNVGQSLRLYKAEVKISSFDTAVSGFTGGVTLTDCAYVTPAYAGEKNGTVVIDSIWGDAPCANLEITGKTVYDLIVDNTRVCADNLDDIRGAGVFSFDPGTNTLHVSGVYDPETIWSGWAINKFRPVIDSSIDGLIIRVDGDTVLTSYLENYNSHTPVINSLGALTICAEGETMPVLTLAHKDDSIPFDGFHTAGALTLQNVDLQIDHCGRGLVGDGTAASSLTFDAACASIMATDGAEDAAVITGFPGGISLQNGSIYFYPGFSVVNGTLCQYGEISLGVRISTGGYNLFVDGYQISNERLSMNFGTIVYDPEANVLYLNGSGEAPVACDSLPYIENHIPGLTIHVVNAIKLPTATEATGRGIIETDVDMTIRSDNCYLALEGNGSGATGIMVKNGAKLTLDGARVNILNVGYGVRGEGGAKLEVVQSWVHANDTASAGLYGFSGGLTLRETDLHTPSGGVIKSGSVFEPDGTTLAKSVELFGAVYELNIDGHWVTYENRADILGDGTFSYDPDTNTLTVSKSYSSSSSATLIQNQIPGLTIALAGDVTLTNTYEDSIINLIYSTGDLTLTGGRLTLLGNGQEESCGLRLSGDGTNLTLDHTVLAVENVTFGLAGRGTGQNLTVLDASLDVSASAAALSLFDGGLSFSDGCGVIEPQNYTLNDDGTVCLGSTPAAHVVVGPLGGYSLWLGKTQVTTLNKDDILGDGTASYDPSTKTLTLNNFTGVQGTHNDALIFAEIDMLTLNLVGTNTLSGSADLSTDYTLSGINAGGKTLIIAGEGSLLIDIATGSGAAIGACDHLIMESGSLCAYAKQEPDQAFAIYGVTVNNLTINGGVLDIYGTYACMPYRSSDHFAIADDYVIMAGYRTDGKDVSACTLPEFLNMLANYPRYNYVHFAPLTAYDVWLGCTQVTNANAADILGDGTASYDPETKTLTFTTSTPNIPGVHTWSKTQGESTYDNTALIYAEYDLTLQLPESGLQLIGSADDLIYSNHGSITILGSILIGNEKSMGIHAQRNITIQGSISGTCKGIPIYTPTGSLLVTGDVELYMTGNAYYYVIYTVKGVEIQGSVSVNAGAGTAVSLIAADNGSITINSDIDLRNSRGEGIYANGTITINGSVTGECFKQALHANGGITVTGDVDVTATSSAADYVIYAYGDVEFGGSVKVSAAEGSSTIAIYAKTGIVIPETHSVIIPAGGTITHLTPEIGDHFYTVTEADSTTPAKHVVIEPIVSYDLWVGGVQVTSVNKDDIPAFTQGTVSFDPDTNTLTFTDVVGLMDFGSSTTAISNSLSAPLTIQGNGQIRGGHWGLIGGKVIFAPDVDLTIGGYNGGIYCTELIFQGGYLKATTGGNEGIVCDRVYIQGGELDVKGGTYGIEAKQELVFSGGHSTVKGGDGAYKYTAIYCKGASLTVTGADTYVCAEGYPAIVIKDDKSFTVDPALVISFPMEYEYAALNTDSKTIYDMATGETAKKVIIEPLVSYDLWVSGVQVTTLNKYDVLGDGAVSFDSQTNTLTVNGTYSYTEAAFIKASMNITLTGTAQLTGGSDYPVISLSSNTLTLDDGADLTVTGKDLSTVYARGLTVNGGSLTVNNGSNCALFCDDLILNSGSITATASCTTIRGISSGSSGTVTVNGGSLYAENTWGTSTYQYAAIDVSRVNFNGGRLEAISGYSGSRAIDATVSLGEKCFYTLNQTNHKILEKVEDGYPIWICGQLVRDANKDDILGDGNIRFDPENSVLTVNGTYSYTEAAFISASMNITLTGTAQLAGGSDYPVIQMPSNTLTLDGGADLTATGTDITAVRTKGLTVNGGSLTVNNGSNCALFCDNLILNSGSITATSSCTTIRGIISGDSGTVTVNGGSLYAKNTWGTSTYPYSAIDVSRVNFNGGRLEAISSYGSAIHAKSGIMIASSHSIFLPDGGAVSQLTDASSNTYYTVTEADGTTPATHVIIAPDAVGDINMDGNVDSLDLLVLRKYLVALPIEGSFDPIAADMNRDGAIDILDLVRLRKVLA